MVRNYFSRRLLEEKAGFPGGQPDFKDISRRKVSQAGTDRLIDDQFSDTSSALFCFYFTLLRCFPIFLLVAGYNLIRH